MIVWKQSNGSKIPEPKSGLDDEFDASNAAVEDAKSAIESYLSDVKKLLNCKEAKLSTASKKYRFEIEIPAKVTVDDDDFILTSKIKDKHRY